MKSASWSSEPWVLVMCIAMGVGAFIVSLVLYRVMSHRRLPKDMRDARDELELATRHIINSNMQLMESIRALADLCQQMPPEYIVVAHQAMRLAQLMEEAAFEEGAREGIFPRPMFTAGDYTPTPGTRAAEPPVAEGENVVHLPAPITAPQPAQGEWINGQLMRGTG